MAGVVRLTTTSVQAILVSSSFSSFATALNPLQPCLPPNSNLNSDKRLRLLSSSPSCSSSHYHPSSGFGSHSLLKRPKSQVFRVKVQMSRLLANSVRKLNTLLEIETLEPISDLFSSHFRCLEISLKFQFFVRYGAVMLWIDSVLDGDAFGNSLSV